jgi:hypothetical protein
MMGFEPTTFCMARSPGGVGLTLAGRIGGKCDDKRRRVRERDPPKPASASVALSSVVAWFTVVNGVCFRHRLRTRPLQWCYT